MPREPSDRPDGVEHLSILDEEIQSGNPNDLTLALPGSMPLARRFDELMLRLRCRERIGTIATVSVQEASQIGAKAALQPSETGGADRLRAMPCLGAFGEALSTQNTGKRGTRIRCALTLSAALALDPGHTALPSEATANQADSPAVEAALPAEAHAFSEQTLQLPRGDMTYQATAAALTLKDDDGRPTSRIFYVSYGKENEDERPLTFVFNGGPGAASAYLHLGAIGPRRLVLGDDGAVPPPPVRLADNAQSWLPFTDLVFVDPPGTGFSRMLANQDEEAETAGDGKDAEAPAWGIEEDGKVLGGFIRRYLTKEGRWSSPIFLAGESYGGFRVALLAERLYAAEGIAASGLVLISPVLDFALIRGSDRALLRWAALLPSYAAVASHHGRGPALDLGQADPRAALAVAERYALADLIAGFSRGLPPDEQQADGLLQRLADFTGLPVAELRRHRGRVPASRFAKVLLADRQRVLSLYDGSLTFIDDQPAAAHAGRDLYLDRLGSGLTAGFHVHLRETLGFETDLPYRLLNREVSKAWNWDSGIRGSQGFADVLGELRRGLSLNPAMGVLILHGVHDLVTPYFASAIALGQMGLDPTIRSNVRLTVYPGGHMFYTRRESRARMRKDAADFYRQWNGAPAPHQAGDGAELVEEMQE